MSEATKKQKILDEKDPFTFRAYKHPQNQQLYFNFCDEEGEEGSQYVILAVFSKWIEYKERKHISEEVSKKLKLNKDLVIDFVFGSDIMECHSSDFSRMWEIINAVLEMGYDLFMNDTTQVTFKTGTKADYELQESLLVDDLREYSKWMDIKRRYAFLVNDEGFFKTAKGKQFFEEMKNYKFNINDLKKM